VGLSGAPAAAATTAPEPESAEAVTPRRRDPETAKTSPPVSYTLRLTADESMAADELLLAARRLSGRRLERSDLIRALLELTAQDRTLLQRVVDAAEPRPRP
jgi:hypothetical protein